MKLLCCPELPRPEIPYLTVCHFALCINHTKLSNNNIKLNICAIIQVVLLIHYDLNISSNDPIFFFTVTMENREKTVMQEVNVRVAVRVSIWTTLNTF